MEGIVMAKMVVPVPALPEERPDEEFLTPAQVANMMHVDPKTVTRWAKNGKIGYIFTVGGHRRYRKSEVAALMRRGAVPPQV